MIYIEVFIEIYNERYKKLTYKTNKMVKIEI